MRRLFRLILVLIIGYYIIEWWLNKQRQQAQPSEELSPLPVKRPTPPTKQVSDSLTAVDGIGPAFERALNAIGIYTFAQLAEQDADILAEKLSGVRVTAARIKKDQWIEQAAAYVQRPESATTRWSANDGKST